MADASTVIEGPIKHRDGKKWKNRWCVVRKLSPVADCLHLQLYRENKERGKLGQTKASLSLEGFMGVESAFTLDKESNTLSIICKELAVTIAFESREMLIQWQAKIHTNLGEGQVFSVDVVHVPPKSRIGLGAARLHVVDGTFSLVSGYPPRLLGHWKLAELRRYGVVSGKFCFEGGSRCGRGEGLHILLSDKPDQISSTYDLASHGKLATTNRLFVRKNSVIGNAAHRTPTKDHWASTTTVCSTESSRPLLISSGSSSTCGGSAEGHQSFPTGETAIPAGGSTLADEQKENYRWPSHGSNEGKMSVTSADCESMETMSIAISDIGEPGVTGWCQGGTTPSWSGHHGPFLEFCCKHNGGSHFETNADGGSGNFETAMNADNHARWRSNERRSESATTNGVTRSNNDSVSVLSHGSSSSSGSNSTNASTPRMLAESLYDRPRAILPHMCFAATAERRQRHQSGNGEIGQQRICEMGLPCTTTNSDGYHHSLHHHHQHRQNVCHQMASTPTSDASRYNTLPNVHFKNSQQFAALATQNLNQTPDSVTSGRQYRGQMGPPPPPSVCGHHHQVALPPEIPTNSGANSCYPSPKRSPSRKSPSPRDAAKTMTSPARRPPSSASSTVACANGCSCCRNQASNANRFINPYGNYDVPRPALCHATHKGAGSASRPVSPLDDETHQTVGVGQCGRLSLVSHDGDNEYNAQRKMKEQGQPYLKTPTDFGVPLMQREICCQPVCQQQQWYWCQQNSIEAQRQNAATYSDDFVESGAAVCACQRVMHWAENLMACRRHTGRENDHVADCCSHNPRFSCDASATRCNDHAEVSRMVPEGGFMLPVANQCQCCQIDSHSSYPATPTAAPKKHLGSFSTTSTPSKHPPPKPVAVKCRPLPELPVSPDDPVIEPAVDGARTPCTTKDTSNYANLEFIQSLGLYENASAVLSRLKEQEETNSGVTVSTANLSALNGSNIGKEMDMYSRPHLLKAAGEFGLQMADSCRKFVLDEPKSSSRTENVNRSCETLSDKDENGGKFGNYLQFSPSQMVDAPKSRDTAQHDVSDYLMMYPCSYAPSEYNDTTMPSPSRSVSSATKTTENGSNCEKPVTSQIACQTKIGALPFIPFMPLSLTRDWQKPSNEQQCCQTSSSSPLSPRNVVHQEEMRNSTTHAAIRNMNTDGPRTARSNSLVEFKKRVFLRKRSSSADSRGGNAVGTSSYGAETRADAIDENDRGLCGGSPKRHASQLSRLASSPMRQNSTREETWPSAEDIVKAIDLSSLGCCSAFVAEDDGEESLGQRDEDHRLCVPGGEGSDVPAGVKRTCSVPCKSGNRDSASSSDSGVSTGSPKQLNIRTDEDVSGVDRLCEGVNRCLHQQDARKAAGYLHCGETCICLHQGALKGEFSQDQLRCTDAKSTSSSTMSDMSDYIETLSLGSGSGDSQDVQRCHGSTTNTLRPRSAKEYQKVDRSTLAELSTSLSMLSSNIGGGRTVTMDCASRINPPVTSTTKNVSPTKIACLPDVASADSFTPL